MPHYFFHLYDDLGTIDEEGRDLEDDDAARRAACLEAREMASESARRGRLVLTHFVKVTDATGRTVCRTQFGDVVTISR